jgi:hypothetical protein
MLLIFINLPTGYQDLGDMNVHCSKCHAMVWSGETVGNDSAGNTPEVSICCMKGNVTIPAIYSRGLIVEVHIFYQI